MQSTQGQRKASIIFGKRKDVGASSSASPSSNPDSNSHLARSPSSIRPSALVRLDPRWPCFACRASRAKCEGGFPCSRCTRLSFCCLPNNWKREDPVLEYVLHLNSPKPFAEMYIRAFERLYLANKILRSTALKVLKMWNVLSCLAGADVTLGLTDHIRERFDISPLELEEPARLGQDPPPHVRMQRLRQFQAHEAKQARTQQLKELEIFKRANEGAEASNAAVLIFVTTEATMWAASNDYFAGQMREATELWEKALQKQMIWAYLLAPIYATEDRQQLFDLLAEMIFGHSIFKLTTFVRMYENNGTSNLCLNSAMKIRLGPHAHGMVFKCEAAPPSRHLTTPKGLARVTSRVRTSRAKVGRRKEERGSPGEGQLSREEGSVVSSDGSVASSEGSDVGLGLTQGNKVAILPFAGIAAFPFGGDGTAPPPPPPGARRSISRAAPHPSPGVSTEATTAMAVGTIAAPRTGGFPLSPSSLVARAAAMPTEELEALFAKKAGGRRMVAINMARGRVKGEESGRGTEEQQEDGKQMGAMAEPPSVSQLQYEGDEHQHHYQQHQHGGHPPQHYSEAQQQVYPLLQQGIANTHLAPYQQRLSSTPVSSLSSPFALPPREDEQIQLARSHFQFQQQQAMSANTYGQQQSFQQQEEAALKAREAGWRAEELPAHRLPLLPFPPLSPAPLLDEALLQDVFAEEGREGGNEEKGKEDKEEVLNYGVEEEEGGGEEAKAGVEEDRNSPLSVPHMDSPGYPWTSMEQHHRHDGYLQHHQQYQQEQYRLPQQQQQQQQHNHAGGGVFSMALCSEKMEDAEEEGVPCAPCLPSLTSPFQGPQPFFHETMLEAVFADKGTEDCVEAEVWRDAEGVEGEIDREEGRKKKRKEGKEGEKGEILDLFKDGDIESW